MNDMEVFLKKINDANTVVAQIYPAGTVEYMNCNKEQIAVMVSLEEIKNVNLQILEELKKINNNGNPKTYMVDGENVDVLASNITESLKKTEETKKTSTTKK